MAEGLHVRGEKASLAAEGKTPQDPEERRVATTDWAGALVNPQPVVVIHYNAI
jgi:hypothetical protein